MFRSLRPHPHTVVAGYLAARRANHGAGMYPMRPFENLRRRAAFARMQRTGANVITIAARASWDGKAAK